MVFVWKIGRLGWPNFLQTKPATRGKKATSTFKVGQKQLWILDEFRSVAIFRGTPFFCKIPDWHASPQEALPQQLQMEARYHQLMEMLQDDPRGRCHSLVGLKFVVMMRWDMLRPIVCNVYNARDSSHNVGDQKRGPCSDVDSFAHRNHTLVVFVRASFLGGVCLSSHLFLHCWEPVTTIYCNKVFSPDTHTHIIYIYIQDNRYIVR